ncbi:MAG: hypothetical protein HQ517_09575 [SAR324 cluster bacterium]|nr:hypothetical protein [SAR324 cluster bacterium]
MKSLYQLKKHLTENHVFLCFNGPFSQELLVEIGVLLKHKMESVEASPTTIFRVFSILVEQSQNIIRFSADKFPKNDTSDDEYMSGAIAVGLDQDVYFVTAGNKIRNTEIDRLHEQLTRLQKMDKEALNKLYKEQRKNGKPLHEKAAGLGLIELARKASQPVEFQFEKMDDTFSFFSIKAVIKT